MIDSATQAHQKPGATQYSQRWPLGIDFMNLPGLDTQYIAALNQAICLAEYCKLFNWLDHFFVFCFHAKVCDQYIDIRKVRLLHSRQASCLTPALYI